MGAMKNLVTVDEMARAALAIDGELYEALLTIEQLEDKNERLREALTRIREQCADTDHENWIWRTADQALKAGGN